MLTRRILFTFVSIAVLSLSGCKIESPTLTITTSGNTNSTETTSQLSCSASLSSSVTSVVSGQAVPVVLQVQGGTSPYFSSQLTGIFASQTTLSDTFQNTGTQNIQVTKSYSVWDSSGNATSCSLSITVTPVNPPSNLVCSFTVDRATPAIGQLVNFGVSVSGGLAPFTSSQYTAGSDTTYASALDLVSTRQFASSAIYGVSGFKTASVRITDASGTQTTCSQSVNVLPAPTVSVTASPAATVPAGSSITLTATASNFSSTPEFTFSTTSGGINLVTSGNNIIVSTTDSLARTVVVNVLASTATQQANTSITLTFTATQTLNCSLYHLSGYYQVGDLVNFAVYSASGENLSLTSLSAQDGTVVDALGGNSARIRFNSSGYKTVYATARSASSGTLCNAGATLTDSLHISGSPINLSCSAITSPAPSWAGEFFLVRAVIPSGAGVGTVYLTNIQTSWRAIVSNSFYNDARSAYMAIYNAGSFPIILTVQDSDGNTATCSTTHVVY